MPAYRLRSVHDRSPSPEVQGFTVLELITATAILLILAAGLASLVETVRYFIRPPNPAVATAAFYLTRDVASKEPNSTPTAENGCLSLSVQGNDLNSNPTKVSYSRSATDAQLTRTQGGSTIHLGNVYCRVTPAQRLIELFGNLGYSDPTNPTCPSSYYATNAALPADLLNRCAYEKIYYAE